MPVLSAGPGLNRALQFIFNFIGRCAAVAPLESLEREEVSETFGKIFDDVFFGGNSKHRRCLGNAKQTNKVAYLSKTHELRDRRDY